MDVHQLKSDVHQLKEDVGTLAAGQKELLTWVRAQQAVAAPEASTPANPGTLDEERKQGAAGE